MLYEKCVSRAKKMDLDTGFCQISAHLTHMVTGAREHTDSLGEVVISADKTSAFGVSMHRM